MMFQQRPSKEWVRKFALFSTIGLAVFVGMQLALVGLIQFTKWNESVANVAAQLMAIAANYQLNKRYTWRGINFPGQTGRFVVARLGTLLVGALIFNLLLMADFKPYTDWPYWAYLMAYQAAGVGVGMVMNFYITDGWVFRDRRPHASMHDLDDLRVGWRSGVMLVGTIGLTVYGLRHVSGELFFTLLMVTLSLIALAAAGHFLISMGYAYRDESSAERLRLREPEGPFRLRLAAVITAYDEVEVLARTILNTVWSQRDYPAHLQRTFVAVTDNNVGDKGPDYPTIRVAMAAAHIANRWRAGLIEADSLEDLLQAYRLAPPRLDREPLTAHEMGRIITDQNGECPVQVVVYQTVGMGSSKARQFNHVLRAMRLWRRFAYVVIVDAEDELADRLFSHVAQRLQDDPETDILQGPVQLMLPETSGTWWQRSRQVTRMWYAPHNVLEYFRCFSGTQRFNADAGVLPLGGNTVFMRTRTLWQAGGLIDNLTEDCATGILLSAVYGAKVDMFYDPALATREQVPPTLMEIVRQRTRWDQGFLQTLLAGHWKALPTFAKRLLAVWILTSPYFQALSMLLVPLSIITMVLLKSPPVLVLMMFMPVSVMVIATLLQVYQLHLFGRHFAPRRIPVHAYISIVLGQFVYQMVLGIAAVRAVYRQIIGRNNWHRTVRAVKRDARLDLVSPALPVTADASA